ncbi:MAG: NACHT domain-containing protein [Deltaproteobacteria bacterium]|nr:NACHT domain-containing protein [Deltaproteobacteria bacterium]
MDHTAPLNRAQAHNALRQIASELSPAVKKMAENLLAQLDDSGVASVKSVHETLFPLAKTTSAAAQLSTLVKKIEEAAQKKGLTLELSFTGTKKEGVAKRQLFFEAPRPTPVADTEGLDAIAPEQRITGQLATPLEDPRILLLTFNDNEFAAVRKAFGYKNNTPPVLEADAEAVDDLGTINGWRILHGHSRQGNRESQRSADVLCRAHHPYAIIAVGIAYGIDEKEQSLGDVLVSRFIVDYEAGRVNPTSIALRNARPPATRRLLHGLEQLNVRSSFEITWPKLRFGGLLSGEKLVDNRDYRDSLLKLANQGDIIGGEMEAAGLFTALDDTGTGWVVVKAICDFADGNKNEDKEKNQQLAATNAASVVHALLSSPFLKKPDDANASPPPLEPSGSTHRKRANLRHDHELLGCNNVNVWGQCANAVSLENIRADDERKNAPQVVAFEHLLKWQADGTAPPLYALLGEYGMGKTTHCQTLTRHLEEQRDAGKAGRAPLYFDLRKVERIAAAQSNALGHVATLEETVQDCLRNGYLQTSGQAYTYQDVLDVIDQGALVIFDGLDEVLSRITDAQGLRFTANLLKVLPEARMRQAAAGRAPADQLLPKVLLSCRTQFFRNLAEQNNHLTGEHRGSQSASQYMASELQPFTDEQIRSYLQAVLPGQDVVELMTMVAAIHNLRELAGRPFTLKLVARFVPRIQSWQQQGRTITGATLYREVAREWLIRDKEKQSFQPQDKERLAGDLAAHLWRTGQRGMRAFELEQWLDAWLGQLPSYATVLQKPRELLHQDLRNATFLKRTDAEKPEDSRFEFAHTSLQEFFLAEYLFRSLQQAAADPGSQDDIRRNWAMPIPSDETLDFLGQILAEAGAHSGELLALSKWRTPYMPLASELQLAYALRAYQRAWPLPVTAGSDLRGAALSDWHFGARTEPGVRPKSTSAMQTPLFDLSGCDFSHAKLRRSKFWRVRLDDAVFAGAALTQTEMLDCSHTRTAWNDAQTAGLVLRPALPDDADFAFLTPAAKKVLRTPSFDPAAMALFSATGHRGMVSSCAFSPNGKSLISASDDKTLKLWDALTGECLRSFSGHADRVLSCAFAPDGKSLISASLDKTIKLWDALTGECLRSFSGHAETVFSCTFAPDGKSLISASDDNTIKLWDALTGECLRTFSGHAALVRSCAFAPDGKSLISASYDNTIKLWDALTGECLRSFWGHAALVTSCAFAPDGKSLLSASFDHTIKLWNALTGECLRSFSGHAHGVLSCTFAPDGKSLISASSDNTIKLWDALTGECLRSFLDIPQGAASWEDSSGKLLYASGRAWRYLRWQGHDQDGNTCVYPLESVPGVAVLPWTLD